MPAKSRKQSSDNTHTASKLVAKIMAEPIASARWIDRLSAEQRSVIQQLRTEWACGGFPAGYSMRSLYAATVRELGITVGLTAFKEYFGKPGERVP
jgi:hypothetical protein